MDKSGSQIRPNGGYRTDRNITAKVVEEFTNTDQKMITVTEDKARLCLIKNFKSVATTDWMGYMGMFLSIILAFATANFRDALGMPAVFWYSLFIVIALSSLILAGRSFAKWWNSKDNEMVQDDIICDLKNLNQK